MKLGVISDIHSNIYALTVCMDRLLQLGCEEFVFLGDYISDTPYARETVNEIYSIIEKYPTHVLRGNREEYLLDQRAVLSGEKDGPIWIDNSCSGNLKFALEKLENEDLDFFEKLPITFVYEKDGYPSITFCHGSPENTREQMWVGEKNTREWLSKISTDYLVAAHTHYPGYECFNGKAYINTGSCGLAITDYGYAQCVILECDEKSVHKVWAPTFLKVPFDVKQVVSDIFVSGLFDKAKWYLNANIHVLVTGIDQCAQLISLAGELQKKETGTKLIWPYIEEKYFECAARELGVPDYDYLRKNECRGL